MNGSVIESIATVSYGLLLMIKAMTFVGMLVLHTRIKFKLLLRDSQQQALFVDADRKSYMPSDELGA